jgi:mono/diheme cytochrome c family protein
MRTLAAALLGALVLGGAGAAGANDNIAYVYRLHCSGCHGTEGAGSKVGRIPPFIGIVGHFASTPEGRLYLVRVPGVANAALPDADTARLLNYVLRNWGRHEMPTDAPDFTAEEVRRFRAVHVDDIAALRRKLSTELAQHGLSTDY